ncbi:MAG: hypothetical protein A2W25_17450 [candidate division Zixibacteria bacterium RBG_16_53_22]|nr:MAG: hypothetical protein A2W25_17450 [candidate division Zixibacteria bacterium RBG_16_53_22]
MDRRRFFGTLSASAIAALVESGAATRCLAGASDALSTPSGSDDIGSYFLDSGVLTPVEQRGVEELAAYQARIMVGESAIRPRGRPSKAATYRLIRWERDLGGEPGSFRGPLSIRPIQKSSKAYGVNAQVIGFHLSSEDWPDRSGSGALTVEFRSRLMGESLTWLYARQFDIGENWSTNLGMEFVGERNGAPQPVITDEKTVDLRIQLMRLGSQGGFLKKVFKMASYVTGLATPAQGSAAAKLSSAFPVVRVPAMFAEGVALSQTLVGGSSEESPIWRSGFVSYALAKGGSRFSIAPGIWVVLDETREEDLREVQVAEKYGQALLVRDGQVLDVNHLVLDIQVSGAKLPRWAYAAAASAGETESDSSDESPDAGFEKGVVPKEVPPSELPKRKGL